MAHSRGFEPLTSAFGGPLRQILGSFIGKLRLIIFITRITHDRDEAYF